MSLRLALVGLAVLLSAFVAPKAEAETPVLVVIFDGLRPDYVTPELMPNLDAFGKAGVQFTNHHAVYPTVTRVNATSIVTGCYPGAHGLMDNAVFFPEVDPDRALTASSRDNLQRIEEATGGKLILVPTLGEILADAGKELFVASAGSTGSAYLLNHKTKSGAIVHPEYTQPAELHARVQELLGPAPQEATPNDAWNGRAVDAYLKIGLDEKKAAAGMIWFTDPDHTAHKNGMGTLITNESIFLVDAQFGRLLKGIEERGLTGKINILVTSDHGFTTSRGTQMPAMFLNDFMRDQRQDPKDMVIAGYGVYFKQNADSLVPALALALQQQDWCGAIFSKPVFPGTPFGANPGCLTMGMIQYENDRVPHILISLMCGEDTNEHGYAGSTQSMGVAGHGSACLYDIRNTFLAAGPGFKSGISIDTPTSNVDIAPTALKLLGMAPGDKMQGRIVAEGLLGGPDPDSIRVGREVFRGQMSIDEGEGTTYTLELIESIVDGRRYLNEAKTTRTKGATAPQAAPLLPGVSAE